MNALTRWIVVVMIGSFLPAAMAQSLDQRVADARKRQREDAAAERRNLAESKPGQFLVQEFGGINLVDIPARAAFEFVATAAGVPIVINWRSLEVLGISPEDPVTLVGRLTGEQALNILVAQLDVDGQLMWDTNEWFVRVLSKEQAGREQYVRIYDIGDLLMDVPDFRNAPQFDLVEVTRAPASGGGGQQQQLLEDTQDQEEFVSTAERGEQIAQLIRDVVEPDAWEQNGGTIASIRYHNRSLVVRAPRYIHRQIGGDMPRVNAGARGDAFRFGPGAPGNPIQADKQGLLAEAPAPEPEAIADASPSRAAVVSVRLPRHTVPVSTEAAPPKTE